MAKRTRMAFPKSLSELIREVLKGSVLAERLREADIWRLWPTIVGPAIAMRTEPVRIINGVLTIAVSSGPWMQELTFLKGAMKEKLNTHLGGEVIKGIVLRSGKVVKFVTPDDDKELPLKELTNQQKALIAEQAAIITDEETRKAFTDLMRTSFEHAR